MKKVFFAAFCCFVILLSGCKKSNSQIMKLQKLEEGVASPSSPEELKAAIQKYQDRVADIQLANSQIGIWYKLLGTRYLEKRMYGEALNAYQNALKFYPDNQNLYFYVGLCAGYMAHTALGNEIEKSKYLSIAEEAQLRALQIEPRYTRALYAIGILYVIELGECDKAIPHLEKLLTIDTKDTDAMFLLARAYYEEQEYDKAAALYDKIMVTAKSEQKKEEAQANKKIVLDAAYAN